MAKKLSDYPLLSLTRSCRPCAMGEHEACRHYAEKDGSYWVGGLTKDDGERRLVRYGKDETGKRIEIPRRSCHCERGGHVGEPGTCSIWKSTDWGDGHRCSKPAKGEITHRRKFGWGIDDPMVTIEVCGIHRAAHERKQKNAAERDAKFEAQRKQWAREKSNHEASNDWADRFINEFHIEAEGIGGVGGILIAIPPEKVYAKLVEAQRMLDEVYGDDHPLRLPRGENR